MNAYLEKLIQECDRAHVHYSCAWLLLSKGLLKAASHACQGESETSGCEYNTLRQNGSIYKPYIQVHPETWYDTAREMGEYVHVYELMYMSPLFIICGMQIRSYGWWKGMTVLLLINNLNYKTFVYIIQSRLWFQRNIFLLRFREYRYLLKHIKKRKDRKREREVWTGT